jgi:hypothetical protein
LQDNSSNLWCFVFENASFEKHWCALLATYTKHVHWICCFFSSSVDWSFIKHRHYLRKLSVLDTWRCKSSELSTFIGRVRRLDLMSCEYQNDWISTSGTFLSHCYFRHDDYQRLRKRNMNIMTNNKIMNHSSCLSEKWNASSTPTEESVWKTSMSRYCLFYLLSVYSFCSFVETMSVLQLSIRSLLGKWTGSPIADLRHTSSWRTEMWDDSRLISEFEAVIELLLELLFSLKTLCIPRHIYFAALISYFRVIYGI